MCCDLLALEVARGQPTALTLASSDAAFARDTAHALHQPLLRCYYSTDVIGVEVGGAVKNVMAIATGICDGLGLGLNARAALITRGLAEMTRLGLRLGGSAETFMGLTGAGDLILTCTGALSRNRRVGLMLASGGTLQDILAELGHVAEGARRAAAGAGVGRGHADHGWRLRGAVRWHAAARGRPNAAVAGPEERVLTAIPEAINTDIKMYYPACFVANKQKY